MTDSVSDVKNIPQTIFAPRSAPEANRVAQAVDNKAAEGEVFVIILGINKYDRALYGKGSDLKYCVADAKSYNQFFSERKQKSEHWRNVNIITLTDSQATKANLRKTFEDIQKRNPKLVVFINSSHGTNNGKEPYICLHDNLYGIDEMREDRNKYFGGAQFIFISDSCYSGGFADAKFLGAKKGIRFWRWKKSDDCFNNTKAFIESEKNNKKLLYKGDMVFAACEANQTSAEHPFLRHGVYTFCFLRGANNPAYIDAKYGDKDANASFEENHRYTEIVVPYLLAALFPWGGANQAPSMIDKNPASDVPLIAVAEKAKDSGSKGVEKFTGLNDGCMEPPPVKQAEGAKGPGDKGAQTPLGRVFVLSVGVNKYDWLNYINEYGTAPMNLRWCVNDAQGIAQALQGEACPSENITVLQDDQATWANVQARAQAIKQKMTPGDKLVMYFSGHGTNDGTQGYICLHDKMVSGAQLGALRDELAGNPVSFIFDSCQNGALIGKGAGQKVVIAPDSKYFKINTPKFKSQDNFIYAQQEFCRNLAKPDTFVYTSCRGDEYSAESKALQHGVFTYALLEGFSYKRKDGTYQIDNPPYSAHNPDGLISMEELVRFASWRTAILSMAPGFKSEIPQHPQYWDSDKGNEFVIKITK